MSQKIRAADFLCFFFEDVDEGRADNLALLLRIAHPFQLAEEEVRGIGMDERNVVMIAEERDDLLRLSGAHDAGIDKHTLQLIADRFMQQHGDDGRIDAAREPANDAPAAHLLAHLADFGFLEGGHRPVAHAAGDLVGEVFQDLRAARRVHHFGVELHAVEFLLVIGDGRKRRAA